MSGWLRSFFCHSRFLFHRAACREIQPADLFQRILWISVGATMSSFDQNALWERNCSSRNEDPTSKSEMKFLLFNIQVGADSRQLTTTCQLFSAASVPADRINICETIRDFNLLSPTYLLLHHSFQSRPVGLNIVQTHRAPLEILVEIPKFFPKIPNVPDWIFGCFVEKVVHKPSRVFLLDGVLKIFL